MDSSARNGSNNSTPQRAQRSVAGDVKAAKLKELERTLSEVKTMVDQQRRVVPLPVEAAEAADVMLKLTEQLKRLKRHGEATIDQTPMRPQQRSSSASRSRAGVGANLSTLPNQGAAVGNVGAYPALAQGPTLGSRAETLWHPGPSLPSVMGAAAADTRGSKDQGGGVQAPGSTLKVLADMQRLANGLGSGLISSTQPRVGAAAASTAGSGSIRPPSGPGTRGDHPDSSREHRAAAQAAPLPEYSTASLQNLQQQLRELQAQTASLRGPGSMGASLTATTAEVGRMGLQLTQGPATALPPAAHGVSIQGRPATLQASLASSHSSSDGSAAPQTSQHQSDHRHSTKGSSMPSRETPAHELLASQLQRQQESFSALMQGLTTRVRHEGSLLSPRTAQPGAEGRAVSSQGDRVSVPAEQPHSSGRHAQHVLGEGRAAGDGAGSHPSWLGSSGTRAAPGKSALMQRLEEAATSQQPVQQVSVQQVSAAGGFDLDKYLASHSRNPSTGVDAGGLSATSTSQPCVRVSSSHAAAEPPGSRPRSPTRPLAHAHTGPSSSHAPRASLMQQQPQPCAACSKSRASIAELEVLLTEERAALAASREREEQLRAELQGTRDKLGGQLSEANSSLALLEAEVRGLYALITKRSATTEVDVQSITAKVAQVTRQKLAQLEEQEVEIGRLNVELRRMAETLSTRELAASAAVAEAEAGREREVEEAQAAAAQLRAKMASLEREHAAQVERLRAQTAAAHQAARDAEQELEIARAQHADHGRLVSERLASAQRRSRELEEVEEEARGLRRQVSLLRTQLQELHDTRAALDTASAEANDLSQRLRRRESELEAARAEVTSARTQSAAAASGSGAAAARTRELEREVTRLTERLESSLAREADLKREVEELKGAVEVKNRELGAAHDLCLESEQQLQQAMLAAQQAIELHASANLEAEEARSAAAQAQAELQEARAAQAPVSMFNDGTQGGVEHENKVLREMLSQTQGKLDAARSERAQAERELKQQLESALRSLADVQAQLAAARGQAGASDATAGQLAAEVKRLQGELSSTEARASSAEAAAERASYAEQQLAELAKQVSALRHQVEHLEGQLAEAKAEAERRVPEAVAEELRSALKEVEDRLAQRTAEVADCREAVREYETAITELEVELRAAQAREQQHAVARDELQATHSALAAQYQALSSRLSALEAPGGPLDRVAQLEADLYKESQSSAALGQQLAHLQAQLDKSTAQLKAREKDVMQLDGTVNILREEVLRLRNGGF